MATEDPMDKQRKALHPLADKKIQQLFTATNNPLFFISSTAPPKDLEKMASAPQSFVNADEFKHVYLKNIQNEMEILQEVINGQMRHIDNRINHDMISLDSDMFKIETVLVDFVKNLTAKYKEALKTKYMSAQNINLIPLQKLKGKVDEMNTVGDEMIKKLSDLLTQTTEFTEETKTEISDMLVKCQDYNENIFQIKKVSSNILYNDQVGEYVLQQDPLIENLTLTRNGMQDVFEQNFSNVNFLKEMILQPKKKISDLVEMSLVSNSYGVCDFASVCNGSLKSIGSWELANHNNHKVMSHCDVNGMFYATGHSDSTLKIWEYNTDYFNTSSGSSKYNSGKSIKNNDFKDPKKNYKPFKLAYTSPENSFKNYVTALTSYTNSQISKTVLVAGDGEGNIFAAKLNYDEHYGKFIGLETFFKKEFAHDDAIIRLERYKDTDVVLSASVDATFAFWNVINGEKLEHITDHESNIQCFQFLSNYEYLCTMSKEELFTWKVDYVEVEDSEPPAKSKPDLKKNNPTKSESEISVKSNQSTARNQSKPMKLTVTLIHEEFLEDFGVKYPRVKCYSTNFQNDYLLFHTCGSGINIINVLTGNYISEMEGVHFKGVSSFTTIANESVNSTLRDVQTEIGTKVSEGEGDKMRLKTLPADADEDEEPEKEDALMPYFTEQLNNYVLITSSTKEKLKAWKFTDNKHEMISQIPVLGGSTDNYLTMMRNKQGQNVIVSSGNSSNKVELFVM